MQLNKPLTWEDFESIRPGTKLRALTSSSQLEEGETYTFSFIEKNFRNTWVTIKEHPSNGWGACLFTLADPVDSLLIVANEGREAANELLKKYADKIEIKDGKYMKTGET